MTSNPSAIHSKGTSSIFWQSVYAGVVAAGRDFDVDILWNGPPRETEFAPVNASRKESTATE